MGFTVWAQQTFTYINIYIIMEISKFAHIFAWQLKLRKKQKYPDILLYK